MSTATTTNLNIRTDKDVKERAEAIFSELGLNMTSAVNMFLRTTIRENGIPFPNVPGYSSMTELRKGLGV